MTINEAVRKHLAKYKIPEHQGILYLLAVYFELDAESIVPEEVWKQVAFSKIIEREYISKKTIWNIQLFNEIKTTDMRWVINWRQIFGELKESAAGDPTACMANMEKFIKNHPDITIDEIVGATKLYVSEFNATNLDYLQTAHYFIYKFTPQKTSVSRLLQYVDLYRKNVEISKLKPKGLIE
jgi:hypothetical protein